GELVEAPEKLTRPPSVELGTPRSSADGAALELDVKYASARQVRSIRAFVEGRNVASQEVCSASGSTRLSLPLVSGANNVSVLAFDDRGFASNVASLRVQNSAASSRAPR